jgi:NitT/TauT family transport system substrate-binding protein
MQEELMSYHKKRRLALILFGAALLLYSPGAKAATHVAIGYPTLNPRIAPLWIADEMGFFRKYNLEPSVVFLRSTPLLIAGMKSGSIPIAYGVGGSILNASVDKTDLKILASFSDRMTNNLVARPGIKAPQDLRKKVLGVQSIGGTNWIGAMLWLEHLGLDPQRDQITILVTGDQTVRAQALEAGRIDAAAVDTVFSKKLEQRGFTVLGDSERTSIPFVGLDVAATTRYIAGQQASLENLLKALLESLAYIVTPENKAAVLALIMKRLRIADLEPAEVGYKDLLRTMSRKPYPTIEGLRNIQRFTKAQNPRIGEIKLEDLVDSRFIRKLDESGFISRLHGGVTVH